MGRIAKYVKSAGERKRYSIDYTDWLDTGELVVSVAFAVQEVTVPPLVFDDIGVFTSQLGVQYYISGGVDGQIYRVLATLTTTVGPQVRVDEIIVTVRSALQ